MPAGGVSTSAFNLTDDVPLPAESPPCSGRWERLELVIRKLNAQAHYASTSSVLVRGHVAEPEEDDYMQYFDWDRYDAEGDEAEAAEQGGAAGGEQGGEA